MIGPETSESSRTRSNALWRSRAGTGFRPKPCRTASGPIFRNPTPLATHNGNGAALPAEGLNLEEHIQRIERSYLLAALERSGGVRTQAAELLKMSYRSFRHYAKKYGV